MVIAPPTRSDWLWGHRVKTYQLGLGNYQVRPLALRNRSFDPTSLGKTVGFIGGYKASHHPGFEVSQLQP